MTGAHLDDRTAVLDANPSLQSYCNNPSRAYKSFRIFGDVRHSAFPFGCGGSKKQQGILSALAMAVHRERSNPGLIFHSDRDVQYTARPSVTGHPENPPEHGPQGESLQQTSSAASNGNWFICGDTTPAALLRQISLPIQLK